MRKLVSGLIGGLAFETTLPVFGDQENFQNFSARSFLFPWIGAILGALLGLFALGLSYMPSTIGAGLFLVCLYMLGGIIHSDGLADFADGLAAGGSKDRRRAIMKDEKTGAAGLVSLVVTNLLLFAIFMDVLSLDNLFTVFAVVTSAEILSKETMLYLICFGKSAHEGMASTFVKKASVGDLLIGTVFAGGFLYLLNGLIGVIPLALAIIVGFVAIALGNWVIGGVSGDIIGAAGEFIRPLALITFVTLSEYDLIAVIGL